MEHEIGPKNPVEDDDAYAAETWQTVDEIEEEVSNPEQQGTLKKLGYVVCVWVCVYGGKGWKRNAIYIGILYCCVYIYTGTCQLKRTQTGWL